MSKIHKQRLGGTSEANDRYRGKPRELTVDTDKNTIRVHDGITLGGHALPTIQDVKNLVSESTSIISDQKVLKVVIDNSWTVVVQEDIENDRYIEFDINEGETFYLEYSLAAPSLDPTQDLEWDPYLGVTYPIHFTYPESPSFSYSGSNALPTSKSSSTLIGSVHYRKEVADKTIGRLTISGTSQGVETWPAPVHFDVSGDLAEYTSSIKIRINRHKDVAGHIRVYKAESVKGSSEAAVPGAPGPAGITPKFRVINSLMYVSYDRGFTWVELLDFESILPEESTTTWKASNKEYNALVEMEDGWYVQMPEIPDTSGTTTVIKRYLSNPSQSWSSDFTSATLESDAGSLIPARASILSAPIVKRVNLPSNIIAETDDIKIQVSLTGKEWFDLPVTLGGNTLPPYDGQYGLGVEFVEGNKINLIVGRGVNANKPWDFNFWWRICILRYTQVIVQYPLVDVLNEMSDSEFKAAESGLLVRKGNKTFVKEGLVVPKIPIGDTGSKWPTLRGINNEAVWDVEAPDVQYHNLGGITPVNSVLAAPSINGKAAYMKVDHYGKKVTIYPNWKRSNGKPVLNRLEYKNWAYALFDQNEGYLIPIWENDYLGYWFFAKTPVNMIRVKIFDNYGVDPHAFPRTFTIQINEDGRYWTDHKVININTRDHVYNLELDETKFVYGIRVLFTNFQDGMHAYARVKSLDVGIMNEEDVWNTSIISAPFEVFESDNFSTSPVIYSFHDGYDAGGLREIIKTYDNPLSGDIVDLAGTQYVYAKYTPATDETTIHCQTDLILERDTGSRWYDAGNTTSTAAENIIFSGNRNGYPASNAFNKDMNTNTGWVSNPQVNGGGNNIYGCEGAYIGQKNLIGQIRQVSMINWSAAPYCPRNVVVEYSVDGANWSILKYHSMDQASSAWNNIVLPEYERMTVPYMMRVRALDSAGNGNDWECAQMLMYTDRKYDDSLIIFNTRTHEYRDGLGNNWNMLYLGRIYRYNAADNNIAYSSNIIVSSERESKAALTNYNYSNEVRWRTQGTSGWFGLKNCKRPLGKMQWRHYKDNGTYGPNTIYVEIQRDNDVDGEWELVSTINDVPTGGHEEPIHTFSYACDTEHCIRFRATSMSGGDSWIVHWAKFYEVTPEDGSNQYHFGYSLHGQQNLGHEYESDWFAVGTSGTYTLFNPLASADLEVHVVWSASNSFDNCCPITTGYRTTDGASIKVDRSNITIITGSSYTMSNQHYSSGGGYYKVFAKRRY